LYHKDNAERMSSDTIPQQNKQTEHINPIEAILQHI